MTEPSTLTADDASAAHQLVVKLDRAHRMSCSDPSDPAQVTLYSEARDALRRMIEPTAIGAEEAVAGTAVDEIRNAQHLAARMLDDAAYLAARMLDDAAYLDARASRFDPRVTDSRSSQLRRDSATVRALITELQSYISLPGSKGESGGEGRAHDSARAFSLPGRELIEAAVRAITPAVTNETHAWNLWNWLSTSAEFEAAYLRFHPRDTAPASAQSLADQRTGFSRGWYAARQQPEIVAATHSPSFPVEPSDGAAQQG